MPIDIIAAVARAGANNFSWEPVVLEDPGPGEVLVRLVGTGVCHTDLSVLAGRLPTPLPAVLGHEGAGVVQAIGEGVTTTRPGDTVVLSFASCGACSRCRTGRPTQCPTYFPLNFGAARPDGTTPLRDPAGTPIGGLFFGQSSLAPYAVVSAQSAVPVAVRDEDELAMLAPIGCGIQTGAGAVLNLLRPEPGSRIAVFGAGAVGLSAVMAARLSGAGEICAVDKVASRLTVAGELGATATATEVSGLGDFDYIIETTGVPILLEQSLAMVRSGGTVAVIGAPAAGTRIGVDVNAMIDGRTLLGVTEGGSDRTTFIPALVELYRSGRLPVDRLVQFYPPAELDRAVADARSGITIKPVIRFEAP
ncbi:NAD(P)-dependent alcohol dehydrogenase [Nocardia salmonicida]|uniref:NAD(P)-dependent alcohol dehydrogenase n=1 Tax=Nocardia salmonicida TaxID=53431 RepID=UPI0007A39559|nr:NAD(P)-dependent alcohol dehydrogenase [Nocardia salmonicida]